MTGTGLVLDAFNAQVAAAAERSGFGTLWVTDRNGREGYTLLGALAACTSVARLGVLVTDVTHRNPAVIAKQVTTIDRISHGRAVLAIGGADAGRVVEALLICRAMFRDGRSEFDGRHYRIAGARNDPPPLQPGGPPILVCGDLGVAARHADGAVLRCGPDDVGDQLGLFARLCGESDRDPTGVRTTWWPSGGGRSGAVRVPGLDDVIVDLGPLDGPGAIEAVRTAARAAR